MNDAISEPVREISHPIDYQVFAGQSYNVDLKGHGTLTLRPEGPTYVFHGKTRALFSGPARDISFTSEEIRNVVVEGRSISFQTNRGGSGEKGKPFIFFCRDETEARAVAALLPMHQDADFAATQDFTAKLNTLAEARSHWDSVTNIIIALNVAVFVTMGCLGAGWFETASMMPYILYGANNGAATTDGEWWRLLSSMFMHYGILHLLLNMWALFQAGHFLEKLQGRWLYALTYLGSGLTGSFASILWHGDKSWSAGASGAIFGVFGAILGYMLRQKKALPQAVYKSMMKSSLTFAGYNILYGMARAGTDNAAHIGGVLGGFLLGWLLALPLDRETRARETGRRLQLGLATVGVLIILGVALTPRFDYRVKDVMAWSQVNGDFGEKETELLRQQEQRLNRLDKSTPDPDYAAWLDTSLAPFYERWGQAISSSNLAPDKATARARSAMMAIFQMRLASYRHLAASIRSQDKAAFAHFQEEDANVIREIQKLQSMRRQ